MLRCAMVASTPTDPHSLATASGLLLGTLAVCDGVGALVGWALGGAAWGCSSAPCSGSRSRCFVVYKVYSGRS